MQSIMRDQKHLFSLPDGESYLNGASRSPQLRSAAAAARSALEWRERNSGMPIADFFQPVARLRESFARLVGANDLNRVALIPAASYGLATVARNLPLRAGQEIIVVEDQFPSNYYVWERRCAETGATIRTVARPREGGNWSERVLDAIGPNTAAVAIAQLHWADGYAFDLAAIRDRTDDIGAWLVVDGTQSVGAFPFDVERIRPDALVAGGYKWLLGPYGCGYAWYGPRLDDGVPLEENWINRSGSDDFSKLAEYQSAYRPLAGRYCVGQHSNFLMVPMQQAALDQLLAWGQEEMQAYLQSLWLPVLEPLRELGVSITRPTAWHLIGLRFGRSEIVSRLQSELAKRGVSVSYRGDAVRVSPNVYNQPEDMAELLAGVRAAVDG